MKSALLTAILGVTVGTLSAGSALAQVPTKLVMTVPFDFQIHGKTLPAGEYTLRPENHLLFVTNQAAPEYSQIVMAIAGHSNGNLPPRAVFARSGDRYYLSEIFMGPQLASWELPVGPAERESLRGATIAKVVLRVRYNTGGGR